MNEALCVLAAGGPSRLEYTFLDRLEGFEGDLHSSEPFGPRDGVPTATMDKELPRELPDLVGNSNHTLVVSPRLRTFLAEHVAEIEFLPIRILDAGKVVSEEFQVAHLINHLDCIDLAAADPAWGPRKRQIIRMNDRRLPLRLDQIPDDRKLFYPKLFTKLPLIRRDFGERLVDAGFTNVKLETIEHALAYL